MLPVELSGHLTSEETSDSSKNCGVQRCGRSLPLMTQSAQALPVSLGDLLRGMDNVGDKSAPDALPAILDFYVPRPDQPKDVPRQIHRGLKIKS